MADAGIRWGPTAIANTETTLITVTAAHTYFLKWMRITNATGTAATVNLGIGADAAGTRLLSAVSIPANDFLDLSDQFLVLAAAETLRATGGTNNALTFTAGGVDVT